MLRYATIGVGQPGAIALESAGFVAFTAIAFGCALRVLQRQE